MKMQKKIGFLSFLPEQKIFRVNLEMIIIENSVASKYILAFK